MWERSADGGSACGFLIRQGKRTKTKQKHCQPNDLMVGDCWIGITQAEGSGLILATRVGKHTDECISQLVVNTEGKTNCQQWDTDV